MPISLNFSFEVQWYNNGRVNRENLQSKSGESKQIGQIESCKLGESNQPLLWIEQIEWIEQIDHQFTVGIKKILRIYKYIFIWFPQIGQKYTHIFIIFAPICQICSANLQSKSQACRANRPSLQRYPYNQSRTLVHPIVDRGLPLDQSANSMPSINTNPNLFTNLICLSIIRLKSVAINLLISV